jgi:DNA primase
VKKSDTLFGLDKVSQKVVMVVESPLDVARVDTVVDGVNAVATFGAHVSKTQIRLLSEHADGLIIAMDNDDAGIESAIRITKQLPSFRYGVKYIHYAHTNAKDIGEMTQDETITAIKKASVLPWWINV